MRIISKFHDYYDSVMIYGQDKTVVYQREEKKYLMLKLKLKILNYIRRELVITKILFGNVKFLILS